MSSNLLSALTLSTIGLASKSFLNLACRDVRVKGLDTLLEALKEDNGVYRVPPTLPKSEKARGKERETMESLELEDQMMFDESTMLVSSSKEDSKYRKRPRRGILTVCNHTSVVDDPMMWGVMPISTYLPFTLSPRHTCRNTRWTLGASDIMFTNKVLSRFFNLGQVIETVRGGGIFQPAIDEAVKKLQSGDWINIFPEGKVNQENLNPMGGLRRFKWGVSRILMDSERIPIIIPIWISGFDDVMPDSRKRLRWMPRPGHNVSITIGKPVTSKVLPLIHQWRHLSRAAGVGKGQGGRGGEWADETSVPLQDAIHSTPDLSAPAKVDIVNKTQTTRMQRQDQGLRDHRNRSEIEIRTKICEVLFNEVQAIGLQVEAEEGKDTRAWRNAVPRSDGPAS